jgi:hypothetical protein
LQRELEDLRVSQEKAIQENTSFNEMEALKNELALALARDQVTQQELILARQEIVQLRENEVTL